MHKQINKSINRLINEFRLILKNDIQAIYIYGSCVLNDFKFGWSDIDILVLTKNNIELEDANQLLSLRQKLVKKEPKNQYYRKFEGAILSLNSFLHQTPDNVVYWGTKGEKIKQQYQLDSFSITQLLENGKLVYGDDIRNLLHKPTFENLYKDILFHYQTIREHGQNAGRNLYSFGWFLDISRCIYTLQNGKIIAKTKAGKWALKNNLCPDKKALKTVLKVRKNPNKYKQKKKIMDYAETLSESIKNYADVLEHHLKQVNIKNF